MFDDADTAPVEWLGIEVQEDAIQTVIEGALFEMEEASESGGNSFAWSSWRWRWLGGCARCAGMIDLETKSRVRDTGRRAYAPEADLERL